MASDGIRILVVDDDLLARRLVTGRLGPMGYHVDTAMNGEEALDRLSSEHYDVLITDWMMPRIAGPELIRKVRELGDDSYLYIIMISALTDDGELAAGLDSGADDYLRKPWSGDELVARVRAGERIVRLDRQLREKNRQLSETIERLTGAERHIKRLEGLLPVCSVCKRVRDEHGNWRQLEEYIENESEASVSHGLCPDCLREHYPEAAAGT